MTTSQKINVAMNSVSSFCLVTLAVFSWIMAFRLMTIPRTPDFTLANKINAEVIQQRKNSMGFYNRGANDLVRYCLGNRQSGEIVIQRSENGVGVGCK